MAVDIALASCLGIPDPDVDRAPLEAALTAAGLRCAHPCWDDPAVDWSVPRITLLRATWNYALKREQFLTWAEATAASSMLWNPLPVVRWNTHKRYLLELEARGVAIAPTVLVPCGDAEPLASILARRGWSDAVVKPAVSAGSYRTLRVGRDNLAAGEAHLRALAGERDVLVQQYLPAVEGYGERSLVWIDGAITHAVRKSPRFEGQAESISPQAMEIRPVEAALAEQALACVEPLTGSRLLYARVDMTPGPEGAPVVMELELVEPSLFFVQGPEALTRMVAALQRELAA